MGQMTCLAVGCAVLIACVATTQKGAERRFVTGPLPAGQKYYYTILARWREGRDVIELSRKVGLTTTAPVRVDFLAPPPIDVIQSGRITLVGSPPK
jgi:uncharacterized protein (TIGR03000 family)